MIDSAPADLPAPTRSSRRALLGAGTIGAAVALVGNRTATAGSAPVGDTALAAFAVGVELAARDLYDDAIAAGASDTIWEVLSRQHESYAQRLAGMVGVPANSPDQGVYGEMAAAFDTASPAAAAYDLESATSATHQALVSSVDDTTLAAAIASIATMEARQATVTAGLAGNGDNLDALFVNTATAWAPEVSS